MAKVVFHPNIQGYSGSILNKTHNFRQRAKWVSNQEIGGFVHRKTPYSPNNSQTQVPKKWNNLCLQRAFILCTEEYYKLLQVGNEDAYRSWELEAMYLSGVLDYNMTVRTLFQGYFMTKYAQTLGIFKPYIYPLTLTSGISMSYQDRDSRQFVGQS